MEASELRAFSLDCKVCRGAGSVTLGVTPLDDSLNESVVLMFHCGACHTTEEHTEEYTQETGDF